MLEPVLNNLQNAWYQKRNHVRIPKIAESKTYLDAAYTHVGGNVPPVNFDLIFDSETQLALIEPTAYLPPASITFVDETGIGGKAFMRVVAGTGASAAHAAVRFVDIQFPQDGVYRLLARISGTAPAATQTRGPCILGRFTAPDPTGPDNGYALGHVRYDSTARQRIRRLIDGTALILDGLDTDPPFLHGDWFWAVMKMEGSQISGYWYKEGDPDPGVYTLSAADVTFDANYGNSGLSFQGANTLNSDIAEFHYEPLPPPEPSVVFVGDAFNTSNATMQLVNEIGDYILLYDVRTAFNSTGGVVDGFTELAAIATAGTPGCGFRVFERFAEAENEIVPVNSGTINRRFVVLYRRVDPAQPLRQPIAVLEGSATPLTIPAQAAGEENGRVVAGFVVRAEANGAVTVEPPLEVLVGDYADVTGRGLMANTGEELVAGFAAQNLAITTARWLSWSLVLKPAQV